MNAGFSGPCPGEKVLLLIAEGNEMIEMLRLVLERKRFCLTIVPTVAEAIARLSEPFDLVWIQLPLPDLQARLLIDLLLATPDLADRVGVLDFWQTAFRALEMPVLETLGGPTRQNQKGIWIRTHNEDERDWLRHHLGQCMKR